MFGKIVVLIKKWIEGFLLELKGPSVEEADTSFQLPDVREQPFQNKVNVFSLKEETTVHEGTTNQQQISIKECSLENEIRCKTGTPEILISGIHLFNPELSDVSFHSENVHFIVDAKTIPSEEMDVFSNTDIPILWRMRVKREVLVDRKKIEGALKVLLNSLKDRKIDRIKFVGYYKNVPAGKISLFSSDLLVEIDKGPSKNLVVFELEINGEKKHVFISVQ
ncbi:MAG: Uncharacterized protein XD64_0074 [Thermotoga sp. 47_83]|jgi:hypothetical protein|uniref:Uncharacterized protein n=4 Tax=Thermotoga TaxID=2335 RepID=A5IIN4_THEP1|nr:MULTISPECIES: hypothetical protein [Thermotoga]KUK22558.1 MAG: Uncharacterized protein XD57_1344 [Thermotoga petrophila]KUK34097.1 MAG: Uncharacterized protein XD64_0074 [Thermotoga sp. 47_83]MDK2893509.1 hypothetical protein [Thermotoga sp.]ABQ46057.1 hypothetical protein Tpet_0028 [Thermotoga petrophila RKU-1]ACB08390.1 conserved hypothetical protein [Thermotoga sp. RQ2]